VQPQLGPQSFRSQLITISQRSPWYHRLSVR